MPEEMPGWALQHLLRKRGISPNPNLPSGQEYQLSPSRLLIQPTNPLAYLDYPTMSPFWFPTTNPQGQASRSPDFTQVISNWSLPLTNSGQASPFNVVFSSPPPPSWSDQLPPLPHAHRGEPVVGFRAWTVRKLHKLGCDPRWVLASTSEHSTWDRGRNQFRCSILPEDHQQPDATCGCGFWVLASLDQLEAHLRVSAGQAVGLVLGWGRVIQHGEIGWRAEFAQPAALLDMRMGAKNRRQTKALAKAYQLPVMSRTALEWLAHENDGQLPLSLPPPIPARGETS